LASEVIQFGQGAEVDAAPSLYDFDAERDGKMCLAGAGLAKKVNGLVTVDEPQLRQSEDPVAV